MSSKSLPSIESLRRQFDYDPDLGMILFKGDAYREPIKGLSGAKGKQREWARDSSNIPGMPCEYLSGNSKYLFVGFNGRRLQAHRVAWALHYGEWPKGALDHINRDPHDNRIENLREATPSQNAQNRRSAESSSSEYLGVCEVKGKWRAQIKIGEQTVYLGQFDDEQAAAIAYDCAAITNHREFANPNIIQNPYLTTPRKII